MKSVKIKKLSITTKHLRIGCSIVFFFVFGCTELHNSHQVKNSKIDPLSKPSVSLNPGSQTLPIQQSAQFTSNSNKIEHTELLRELNQNLGAVETQLRFESTLEHRISSNGNCYLTVVHLRLLGLANTEVQDKINVHLEELPESTRNFYQQELEDSKSCTFKFKDKQVLSPMATLDQCRVTLAKGNILSLECFSIYGGGLYPILSSRAITLNLRTGEIYQYPDLFKQDVDYIKAIRELIQENYIPPNLPESIKAEFYSLNHKNASFYLSSSCDFPSEHYLYKGACLVISKPLASGVRQQKIIQIKMSQLNKILSSEPDLQTLLK